MFLVSTNNIYELQQLIQQKSFESHNCIFKIWTLYFHKKNIHFLAHHFNSSLSNECGTFCYILNQP